MGWESHPKRRGIDGLLRGKRRARSSLLGHGCSPDDGREHRPSVCRDRRHGAPGKPVTAQFHHDLRSFPPRGGRPHIQICDTRVRDVCRRSRHGRHRVRNCRLWTQVYSGPLRVEGPVRRIGHLVDHLRAPRQRAYRPAGNTVGTGREHPLLGCQDRPSARIPRRHFEPWRLLGVDSARHSGNRRGELVPVPQAHPDPSSFKYFERKLPFRARTRVPCSRSVCNRACIHVLREHRCPDRDQSTRGCRGGLLLPAGADREWRCGRSSLQSRHIVSGGGIHRAEGAA